MGIDDYLNAYIDRRMALLIEEYGISTKADLRSQTQRLKDLQQDIERFQTFDKDTKKQVASLKERAYNLKVKGK